MKPISDGLIRKLKLVDAIKEEANSTRNLLPVEYAWDDLIRSAGKLAKWLSGELRAGFDAAPQEIVSVRKLQGTRPASIWGAPERIIYRALTVAALGDRQRVDRSPDAYINFVNAPLRYSQELQRKNSPSSSKLFLFFLQSEIKYVVKTDITAFYQYVDHSILSRELMLMGADFEVVEALIELLGEVQGRAFGIPQMYDASDELSELYIDRLERDLLRRGLNVWRYNDDFRIACRSYAEALKSIEVVDSAAREIGLVISESKTLIYRFTNYMTDTLGLELSPDQDSLSLEDVETTVGDYGDDFSERADDAVEYLQKTVEGDESERVDKVNLRKISSGDLRLLRRAIGSLAKASDPRALVYIYPLAVYVPALYPSLMRYLRSAHEQSAAAVEEVIDRLIDSISMNEWQSQWTIQLMDELNSLGVFSEKVTARIEWVKKQFLSSPSPVTVAFASRALASVGSLSEAEVVQAYESSPSCLTMLHLEALKVMWNRRPTAELKSRIRGISQNSPIHDAVLGDVIA